MASQTTSKSVFILASFAPSLVLFRLPLIEQLLAAGHRVAVGAKYSEFRDHDIETLERLGVDIFDIDIARNSIGVVTNLRTLFSMRRALKAARCDVLIAYTMIPVIFGTFAAKLAGYRHVVPMVTGLGSMFIGTPSRLKDRAVRLIVRKLYRLAFFFADVVYFQNRDDPRDLQNLGALSANQDIAFINGSGVDTTYFAETPPRTEVDQIGFLMVGRLLKDKGVREYSEAARLLSKKYPKASFTLIGPIDSNPTSIAPDDLKSWTWIRHIAWLDDVRPELERCDVYVLPSYREGTPRSVLEAMAVGRAIITTDTPGCRETVEDGKNGYLVPVRDVKALTTAMEKFISTPDLIGQMGRQSRANAVAKYDQDVVYREMVARIGAL